MSAIDKIFKISLIFVLGAALFLGFKTLQFCKSQSVAELQAKRFEFHLKENGFIYVFDHQEGRILQNVTSAKSYGQADFYAWQQVYPTQAINQVTEKQEKQQAEQELDELYNKAINSKK